MKDVKQPEMMWVKADKQHLASGSDLEGDVKMLLGYVQSKEATQWQTSSDAAK